MMAQICGPHAGRAFRHEPGKHVVQRVPPTESNGRRQTSVVSVGVLPIPPDNAVQALPEEELEITTTKGTGPGGQHKNKTESAVRIVHKPTKISVLIDGRDQHSNKREARRILTARVNEARNMAVNAEYAAFKRKQMGDGGRGDKIRTYNFIDSRVVDHRLGTKTGNIKGVMKGDFSKLFRYAK
jgi:peptide chain release factor 1